MSAPRIGDEVTLTGTVRTVERIWPEGHMRITLDVAPPKPAEPTGLGAVVEDADGDFWVYAGMRNSCGERVWRHADRVAVYAQITVARVLSEGWSA